MGPPAAVSGETWPIHAPRVAEPPVGDQRDRCAQSPTHRDNLTPVSADAGPAAASPRRRNALNLFDQQGQIGAIEAQPGGWDTMMFDVRRHMLVVGSGAGQSRIVGVWLRVIPVELLAAQPDLVTVI